MQIKNIIITIVSLAAVNASPVVKRAASWDQCMTMYYDRNQGAAVYNVAPSKQAEVYSKCKICIDQNTAAGCVSADSPDCRARYDACAAAQGINLV